MHVAHRCEDFLPLTSLAGRKQKQGASISLVIPALNEEKTVGEIVRRARIQLQEDVPLLDEIIVMDGGSSDHTRSEAESAGASLYTERDVLPQFHYPPGKGTSLWKSLFVARGDILVFVDADITDFSTGLVYGLAGALLHYPDLQCAKAAYDRPFVVGSHRLGGQGGRVTEILVRPLLSAWYPELATLSQPLSGESAFRRAALEQVEFSSGYSVELLLLLEMRRRFGLESIAEVQMPERAHRNRSVGELGAMASSILKTFMSVLEQEERAELHDTINQTMACRTADGWDMRKPGERRLPPPGTVKPGTPA